MNMGKNVVILGIVSLLNDMSSKIIIPLLPLFIKDIGGTGIAIGLISGLGESIASIFKMLSGYWSDKTGRRKPFVFAGYFISSISKLMLAFSRIWPEVLLLRSMERFGKGMRSAPRDAILAESTEKSNRGRGFGLHRAMDSAGAVIGSLLAFALFWFAGLSFTQIFLFAGVLAFLALIPLLFVKEKKGGQNKTGKMGVSIRMLPLRLRLFMLVATIFALANFSYMFFVLKTQPYFAGTLSIGVPVLLYALYQLSYTIFALPAGILSDKIGRKGVLIAGYTLFALVCAGFIFASDLMFFILLFVLFGINYAMVNANERAFVADLAPAEIRGTALGTYHMLTSIAALPAGIIAGVLWDINANMTFIYGAALAITAVVIFMIICAKCK